MNNLAFLAVMAGCDARRLLRRSASTQGEQHVRKNEQGNTLSAVGQVRASFCHSLF